MFRFHSKSLGCRLLLVVFLILLLGFGVMTYVTHQQLQQEKETIRHQTLQLVKFVTSAHNRQLETFRALFKELESYAAEQGTESRLCEQLLAKRRVFPPSSLIAGVATPNGEVRCSSGPLAPPGNVAGRAWLRRTLTTGRTALGHHANASLTNRPSLTLGYPVSSQDGQVQKVLFATLDLGWIMELAPDLRLHQEQSTLTLFDDDGKVLAHHPHHRGQGFDDVSQLPVFRSVVQRQEGTLEATGADGRPRLYAFTPLYATPQESLYVLYSVPSAVAFATVHQAMTNHLIELGIVLVLVLVLVSAATKWFVLRHLNALIALSKRFAEGDWDARAEHVTATGELHRLATAFYDMAESLRQREQQQNETAQKLLRSRQTLATLFESMPFSVVLVDQDMRIRDVNQAFLRTTGFPSKEGLLERHCSAIFCFPEDGRCPVFELGRDLHWAEQTVHTHDGRQMPILKSVVPILLEDQQLLLEAFVDITERKEAERAIEESKQRYRAVVQDIPAIICRFLPDGRLTFVNKAFCETFGNSQEEPLGQDFFQFLPAAKRQTVKDHYQSLTAAQPMATYQHRITLRDGSTRWQQWTYRALFKKQDDVFEYQFVGIDITEQKKVEETLRLNERRLEALLNINQIAEGPLEEIVDFALQEGIRLTKSAVGYLGFVNAEETAVTMYTWSEGTLKECTIPDRAMIFQVESGGLWTEALRQRRAIIANEYQAQNPHKKGYPEGHVRLSRHMNVPVFDGDRIVVLVGVGNKYDPYDDLDVRQLTLLMNGMWNLIQRRHAKVKLQKSLEETVKSRQRLKALLEASKMILEQDNFAAAASNVFKKCQNLLGAPLGCLAFFDQIDNPASGVCVESVGLSCQMSPQTPAPLGQLQQKALQKQQIVYQNELLESDAAVSFAAGPVPLKNVLFSPLVIERKTAGLLGLGNKPGGFGEEDVQVVTAFSELAALAFLNHRADKSLRESEERFRTAFDMIPDAIGITKIDGAFVDINEGFTNLTRYSKEQILNCPAEDVQFWEDPRDEARLAKLLTRQNYVNDFQAEIRCKGGERKTTLTSARRIILKGRPHILIISRDITRQQELEQQLRQAQKMEALGTLAGGIAHDFNNILGIIMGYMDLVQLHIEKDSPAQKLVLQVLTATERAKDLVQQILAFSRHGEQEIKPLQIGLLIKETLKLLRASLPSTITIKQSIASKDMILADPTQIHQVLMNLCTNSAHAMGDGGGILEVALDSIDFAADDPARPVELAPGSYLRLTVRDTGHGIPPAIIDRIFDPYFTTKGPSAGTGLGLAVVHGIVKRHQGAITVQSQAGAGATFQLYFRRLQAATRAAAPTASGGIAAGTERILVVDDEKDLLEAAKAMLEHFGYRVTAHSGSREALQCFRADPDAFDLVITDQTMPHLTGLSLAKAIQHIRADLPIILCTGFNHVISEEKLPAMGIRKLVTKPFAMQTLAAAVREILDESVAPGEGPQSGRQPSEQIKSSP